MNITRDLFFQSSLNGVWEMDPRDYIFIGGPHHRCSGLDVSGTLPYPTLPVILLKDTERALARFEPVTSLLELGLTNH